MGMDTNPLPPGLAVMLTDINDTFNENFLRLAVKISPSDYFDLAFKLKQKIDDIEEYGQGAEDWFYKLLVRDVPLTREYMHDCLMSFVLNAEYMLFQFYCQLEPRKNPFLVHWVEVVKKWEKVFRKDNTDSKGKGKATTLMRKADSDIFEKRLHFVKAILLNEGPSFGSWTPQEFCGRFAEKDRVVNLDYYTELLSDMDELALTGDLEIAPETAPASLSAHDEMIARLMQKKLVLQERFTKLLTNSPHIALNKEEVNAVIRELEEDPTIITIFNIRYIETTVVVTTEANYQWTLKILRILLGHPTMRGDRRLDIDRQALVERIAHFPVTVSCLDLITTLIISKCFEDVSWLVHTFLDHALNGLNELETIHRENASEVVAESADMPVTRARNLALESHQIQGVRYLILFIRSLVNKGIMTAQDLATQINEIGVRLAWLPEARQFQKQMLSLSPGVAAAHPVVPGAWASTRPPDTAVRTPGPSVASGSFSTIRSPAFPAASSSVVDSSSTARPQGVLVAAPLTESSSMVESPVVPSIFPQKESATTSHGSPSRQPSTAGRATHFGRGQIRYQTPRGFSP